MSFLWQHEEHKCDKHQSLIQLPFSFDLLASRRCILGFPVKVLDIWGSYDEGLIDDRWPEAWLMIFQRSAGENCNFSTPSLTGLSLNITKMTTYSLLSLICIPKPVCDLDQLKEDLDTRNEHNESKATKKAVHQLLNSQESTCQGGAVFGCPSWEVKSDQWRTTKDIMRVKSEGWRRKCSLSCFPDEDNQRSRCCSFCQRSSHT